MGDYRDILSCPDSNGDGRIGAIHDIAYIMDAMSVINGESAPSEFGNYEIYADFADLTRNAEEDRSRALLLTDKGFYPKWYYLVHNEGFTEEEARAIVAEAKSENEPKEGGLFGEE